jgi:hypothetical protein
LLDDPRVQGRREGGEVAPELEALRAHPRGLGWPVTPAGDDRDALARGVEASERARTARPCSRDG